MQINNDVQRNNFSSPISLKEWLVARHMPRIYERAFGEQAGRSSKLDGDKQVAGGPFVRFVTIALAANGIAYAKDSVRTAFQRLSEAEHPEKKATRKQKSEKARKRRLKAKRAGGMRQK